MEVSKEISWAAANPLAFGILITFVVQAMFWIGYCLGFIRRRSDKV